MSRVVALHQRAAAARIRLLLARDVLMHADGGAPLPLTGKDGALLAWLAIEGPTPCERLARLVWPESDDAAARNALRQRIFKLEMQAAAADLPDLWRDNYLQRAPALDGIRSGA